MEKKTVREMGWLSRKRRSLTAKTLAGVQILALLMGVVLVVVGFALYFYATLYEYTVNTSTLARAEALVLDTEEAFADPGVAKAKVKEIIDIYDSIPEDEKGDGTGEAYARQFDSVIDEDFESLRRNMQIMKNRIGLRNAFVVAIDLEHNRMVYLIDSDPEEATVCHPGSWDVYERKELEVLVDGRPVSKFMRRLGLNSKPQATITNTANYGRRCTGGATMFKIGDYSIMLCLDEKLDHLMEVSKFFLIQYVLLMLVLLIIISFIVMRFIRKLMVNPINLMAGAAKDYARDKQSDSMVTDHFKSLDIHSGDEIEELNLTMADMEESLAEYVENLTRITAERERISTELELASKIQEDMLPSTFPPFPGRGDFDIYASMDPAKEVGGDFYDFMMVDDDHIAMVIADVSGKGIPAALFMMISKIILNNRIMEETSPAEILAQVNDTICKNNREEMFVTVWLGILEISTGKIVAANAGHEKPVIIHADGSVEVVQDKHGFVIGGMEGIKYKDYELTLEKGSKIFVYTDGVPEATSKEKGLFGMERLEEALQGMKDHTPMQVLQGVRESVDEFVGEDEQFDDLTMLCLEYKEEER